MRNCFHAKTKSSKHLERSKKKFRTTNPTYYNYQNTKNAVLGGVRINKHWIRVLTIRALLQPECNGISISKHWICTGTFTCWDNFAMARVLTSNGFARTHWLVATSMRWHQYQQAMDLHIQIPLVRELPLKPREKFCEKQTSSR